MLFPEERGDRSKTYAANDTIEMHCAWCQTLERSCAAVATGDPRELVFPLAYPQALTVLRDSCRVLQLHVVPYQARHSGPSIDAALGTRTRKELKDRGRWKDDRSLRRYEQRARLMKSFNAASPSHRALLQTCERLFDEMFMGRVSPDAVVLRS